MSVSHRKLCPHQVSRGVRVGGIEFDSNYIPLTQAYHPLFVRSQHNHINIQISSLTAIVNI